MAVRASMEYIIAFVRDLINDPSGDNAKFTDQQIQDRLDLNRLDLYQSELREMETINPDDGHIEWHDFFARLPFWETDYLIQEVNGEIVPDADVAEPLIGKWHWDEEQIYIPYVITGKVYNVYGVAATLITMWIAEIRSQIQSWTADGTTIQRTGQIKNMQDLAATYWGMAWGWGGSTQVKLVRKDLRN